MRFPFLQALGTWSRGCSVGQVCACWFLRDLVRCVWGSLCKAPLPNYFLGVAPCVGHPAGAVERIVLFVINIKRHLKRMFSLAPSSSHQCNRIAQAHRATPVLVSLTQLHPRIISSKAQMNEARTRPKPCCRHNL